MKGVICLDVEHEYEDLTRSLGGSYIDFLSGKYLINVLEPKIWSDEEDAEADDSGSPEAFRRVTRLSQHIAFLKDFFRSYKGFTDAQIDTIEILLEKLYTQFGITDETDFSKLTPLDYPVLSDLYKLCEKEFRMYDDNEKNLYTEDILREICLGLHSMCVGSESKYFNGYYDPATKNNLDLVQWAIEAHSSGWGYVWGTYGHVLTRSYYEAKLAQYPEGVGNYADFILANWLGKRTADCVGLVKGYCWFDPEAQSIGYAVNGMPDIATEQMIEWCDEKGSMDTMPEIPGLLLWMDGHVGIYIGDGYAIEAMGTRYGVVKTQVAGRGWQKWGKIPSIEYIEEAEETEPTEAAVG